MPDTIEEKASSYVDRNTTAAIDSERRRQYEKYYTAGYKQALEDIEEKKQIKLTKMVQVMVKAGDEHDQFS